MTDPITLALRVAATLDQHNISYALGGSLASSMFGEPRGTIDIDLAVQLERQQLDDFLGALDVEFYVPFEAASQVLRKLEWYRAGGSVSERQWRDVVGILRAQRTVLDLTDLSQLAASTGLDGLLAAALKDAESSD